MIDNKGFKKRAMMGVGVLLIFIATILVSAIAAGVLIRTSGAIGQKSIEVEKVSRERLTTGYDVVKIVGYANVTPGTIQEFEVLVRLKAGSSPVDFGETYITFVANDLNARLQLSNTSAGGVNCSFGNLTPETEFCYEPLFGNTNTKLEEEELVYLRFKVNDTNAVEPNDDAEIQLIPKVGELTLLSLRIPSIKQTKVDLY